MKRLTFVIPFFFTVLSCKSLQSASTIKDSTETSNYQTDSQESQEGIVGDSKGSSYFNCKQVGSGYRPYYMRWDESSGAHVDYSQKNKGLLGAGVMRTEEECQRALEDANHEFGVICSATGLGWKPTLYTGTVPGRADYGYLGGSSMAKFEDCLLAVRNSSEKGVCFYGGTGPYYIARIDRAQTISGPFNRLADCVQQTKRGAN